VAVKEEGRKGLSAYFEQNKGVGVLSEGGLPPFPVAVRNKENVPEKYELLEDQSYQNQSVSHTTISAPTN
jgi:hypothetical protein